MIYLGKLSDFIICHYLKCWARYGDMAASEGHLPITVYIVIIQDENYKIELSSCFSSICYSLCNDMLCIHLRICRSIYNSIYHHLSIIHVSIFLGFTD